MMPVLELLARARAEAVAVSPDATPIEIATQTALILSRRSLMCDPGSEERTRYYHAAIQAQQEVKRMQGGAR